MPRCAIQTGCAHRGGRLLIRLGAASPPAGRTSSPDEATLSTAQGGLCAKRESSSVSCGRRERSYATEHATQWDGRETLTKRHKLRGSVPPRRAPHRPRSRARAVQVSVFRGGSPYAQCTDRPRGAVCRGIVYGRVATTSACLNNYFRQNSVTRVCGFRPRERL